MIIGIHGKKNHGKNTVAEVMQYLFLADEMEKEREVITLSSIDIQMKVIKAWGAQTRFQYTGWEEKSFASKVKQIVCLLIGCTMAQLEDQEFKEKELGEEWRVYFYTKGMYERVLSTDPDIANMKDMFGYGSYVLTPRKLLQLVGTECGRQILHPNIWVNALMSDHTKESKWLITDVRFPNEVKAIKDRGGLVFKVVREDIVSTDTHPSETSLDSYRGFDSTIYNPGPDRDIRLLVDDVKAVMQKHNLFS